MHIRLARSARELDQVFRLRHRVLIDECAYFDASRDGCFVDRFDTFPTTAHVIALDGETVVGALRIVDGLDAPLPCTELFDFAPHVPARARVAAGGHAGRGSEVARRHVRREDASST